LAPAKLDHLIYGYTAGLGRGATWALDQGIRAMGGGGAPKPSSGWDRTPGIGVFYRKSPNADAQSFQDFYNARKDLDGALRSVSEYRGSGDHEKANKRMAQLDKKYGGNALFMHGNITHATSSLKLYATRVNYIFASRTLTPDEKREQLRDTYADMLRVVRNALGKEE
jgi:hypothetical protein